MLRSPFTLLGLSPAVAQGLYVGPEPAPPTHTPPSQEPRPLPISVRPGTPAIRATSLAVRTSIENHIATTHIEQVLHNSGRTIGEGTWILPLPPGALADGFEMIAGGVKMEGEVLDAARARQIYEDIVRRQRDPGLLEYFGGGCLRARVFPIPAQGNVTVSVRYRQVLPVTAGLHSYTFPLRAAGLNGAPPEQITLDVSIHSTEPLLNVYTPLGGVDISRNGDHRARVTYEAKGQLPARDLQLHYGIADGEFGLNLMTHCREGEAGTFLMLLAPKQEWPVPENTAKKITFVIDTSGSMKGTKIAQARGALRFFLRSLHERDLFNVVPFSTAARPFFAKPTRASAEEVERALGMVDGIDARGGTNIEDALLHAVAQEATDAAAENVDYVPITVFLTDGLPTVGTTDADALRAAVRKANRDAGRVFVFGVGNDVNTALLDGIAADSRGDRDYVRDGEDIEVKTGALFTKLSHPVMTGVEIVCDGIEGFDVFPRTTLDLFKGSRLLLLGRYRGTGQKAIRLKGTLDGRAVELVFEGEFTGDDTRHDFVPALWAERKIAMLLEAIRTNGQQAELVEEVRRLGKEFGIVTPFTSHLIVEEGMRVARARGIHIQGNRWSFGDADALPRLTRDFIRAGALPPTSPAPDGQPTEVYLGAALGQASAEAEKTEERLGRLALDQVGADAVNNSVGLSLLAKGEAQTPAPMFGEQGGLAGELLRRRVGERTFYLAGGVWVDGAFREADRARLRTVEAFSDDYFALLRKHPDLAAALALSSRLVLVVGDEVIEVR